MLPGEAMAWPLGDPVAGVVVLVLVGVLAGVANTLAGGGSFVVLPILIGLGLTPGVANATSRIGVLAHGSAAALTFARAGALSRSLVGGLVLRVAPMMCVGALGGAWLATRLDDALLRPLFGAILVVWAVLLLVRPGRFLKPPPEPRAPGLVAQLVALLIGVYGGFLQAGVGFPLMALFVSLLGYPALQANAAKVTVVFIYTLLAMGVFAAAGQVAWREGAILAAGMVLGGVLGARLQLSVGPGLVRWAMVVMVAISGAALLL
ncbi:sulfite exporter TauE/SafE family protein [Nannocystis sp.]|uniref:sulfite exporter TauE/SafE family protein n=1 Tax=Nannocystis sp. TaxID=1962667 RepID=UPI0025D5EAD7|nr:sulfite exporter TauE/SafE family protein [Nannocystis sp.]MBK7827606.1 sulfite exporter TauE/SafE family protein [Nannocystis sp.]